MDSPGPREAGSVSQPSSQELSPEEALCIGPLLPPPGSFGDHEDPYSTGGETEAGKESVNTQGWAARTQPRRLEYTVLAETLRPPSALAPKRRSSSNPQ